jgi:Zn-dependent protease with chaperone function
MGVAMISERDGRAHYGTWRAACALPSLFGSVLVLAMAFGWLGTWSGLVLLGWLLVAAALLCRPGERVAVMAAYRYRDLSVRETALLGPIQHQVVHRCGLPDDAIDWYVRRTARGMTGYAAGARSVAVSADLVDALERGRLSEQQALAILTHEAAHHLGRATRYGLMIGWLTAPWRLASAVFGGLLRAIVRGVPTARVALLLVPVVGVVAGVQLVQRHEWLPLVVLVGLALVVGVQPLADAAISRASERAADEHTARLGSGPDLAAALQEFHTDVPTGRWLATHPKLTDRLAHLAGESSRRQRSRSLRPRRAGRRRDGLRRTNPRWKRPG